MNLCRPPAFCSELGFYLVVVPASGLGVRGFWIWIRWLTPPAMIVSGSALGGRKLGRQVEVSHLVPDGNGIECTARRADLLAVCVSPAGVMSFAGGVSHRIAITLKRKPRGRHMAAHQQLLYHIVFKHQAASPAFAERSIPRRSLGIHGWYCQKSRWLRDPNWWLSRPRSLAGADSSEGLRV